jgi:hypothetical protein
MRISFGLQILMWTALNALVLYGFNYFLPNVPIPLVSYLFLGLFALITLLIHRWLVAANNKSPQQFVTFFMGSITLKLFFTVTLLFVYLYLNREQRVPVALSFMSTYLLFTVIEVVSLYKLMVPKT